MQRRNKTNRVRINNALFWFGVCFFSQILLILMQEFQCNGEHYQPLLYLFGKKYGRNSFYETSETMMFLTQLTYCIMVMRRIVGAREENAFMTIPRYESYRAYYGTVYREFVCYTVVYQAAVLMGSVVGYLLVLPGHHAMAFDGRQFAIAQVCMLMGNLLFGAVMSICILRWNALRTSILIYPGIPLFSYYTGSGMPVRWSNLLPGTWLMAARSSMVSKGGYSVPAVLLLELVLFVGCSYLLINMRSGKQGMKR